MADTQQQYRGVKAKLPTLLDGQLGAFAVQSLDGIIGQMNVSCGGFHQNFVCHDFVNLSFM